MEEGGLVREKLTLVARKPCFGLPTACPKCLPIYIYLRFAKIPFSLEFNLKYPDSDQIPYVESGDYVAYNNEKGGVIPNLRKDGIADLDSEIHGIPEWVSMIAMVESWLADAVMYELWVGSDGKSAREIYYSDLPWPIGKVLHLKQVRAVKQLLGITSSNAERIEEEIYRRATLAYGALSSRLGEESLFFDNRPTSLDAFFLGHVLFTLHALPESSVLRSKLLEHANLINYADTLRLNYIDGEASSSVSHVDPSSSTSRQRPSYRSSKPTRKPKREITEEEKKFKRKAKYFLATQLVAVLVFMSIIGGSGDADVELEDDDYSGLDYE